MPKGDPLNRTVIKDRWNKKTYENVRFRLRKDRDADVIQWLSEKPSKNAYLVELIRRDMEASRR